MSDRAGALRELPYELIGAGAREAGGTWRALDLTQHTLEIADDNHVLSLTVPGAAAVELVFRAPPQAQFLGGGERFDALDLRGQSVRYYLENFALGAGTYLPIPWIATTAGFSLWLDGSAPVTFHLASPWDPGTIRVQVEGEALRIQLHLGLVAAQYAALIKQVGPPLMPNPAFFGLWKAGDWRFENASTIAADVAGFKALNVPLAVKLIDAYWEDEVHSFAFDEKKYPDAWAMVRDLAAQGTEVHLWLCPWVVVNTRSYEHAKAAGYIIKDAAGALITRRPGANPNIVAALIDFSNPQARNWWSKNLKALLDRGIAGFKADFGEQLPEHAVLHSGETGGAAHNSFVRHYLEATADAFAGRRPAVISRSGNTAVRTQIWSGDQTSDFCPKSGLPASIRAAQSASLCGWSFVGSDLGGYFGTATPQVFARWTQFSCFTPLMQLHGLGCREPWDMDAQSSAVFQRYAAIHLALLPYFQHHGRIAADGGQPLIRMMPLAFPDIDWRSINDWDQQFMLGDALLVAPVAFYANTRAVYLPDGDWFDIVAGQWTHGGQWIIRETAIDDIPVFIRAGSRLYLRDGTTTRDVTMVAAEKLDAGQQYSFDVVEPRSGDDAAWRVSHMALLPSATSLTVDGVATAATAHPWLKQLNMIKAPAAGQSIVCEARN